VGDWLQHLDLPQYQRLFLSAGHTMHSIHTLTEAQLVAMGVPTVGARRRMLNGVEILKRSLPQQPADQQQMQAKKRNKTHKTAPSPAAAAASSSDAAPPPPPPHAASLPQQRCIARITEKAAEQAAAAMLTAAPPAAPAPTVPFLAHSSMPDTVPLFPGSIMRRVRAASRCLLWPPPNSFRIQAESPVLWSAAAAATPDSSAASQGGDHAELSLTQVR
jgi:hypothetical protein